MKLAHVYTILAPQLTWGTDHMVGSNLVTLHELDNFIYTPDWTIGGLDGTGGAGLDLAL